MPEEKLFFLSKALKPPVAVPISGAMLVYLSDISLITNLNRRTIGALREAMQLGGEVFVLCECKKTENGFKTVKMAIVESFKKDSLVPSKMRPIFGLEIVLSGDEEIIDHTRGQKRGCFYGVRSKEDYVGRMENV